MCTCALFQAADLHVHVPATKTKSVSFIQHYSWQTNRVRHLPSVHFLSAFIASLGGHIEKSQHDIIHLPIAWNLQVVVQNAIEVHLVLLQQRFQDLLAPSILSRRWRQQVEVCSEPCTLWNGWHMLSAPVSCIKNVERIWSHRTTCKHDLEMAEFPCLTTKKKLSLPFAMAFADSTCPGWVRSCWGIAKLFFAACQQWPWLPDTILMILRMRNCVFLMLRRFLRYQCFSHKILRTIAGTSSKSRPPTFNIMHPPT